LEQHVDVLAVFMVRDIVTLWTSKGTVKDSGELLQFETMNAHFY
jgi:hypothetical protein